MPSTRSSYGLGDSRRRPGQRDVHRGVRAVEPVEGVSQEAPEGAERADRPDVLNLQHRGHRRLHASGGEPFGSLPGRHRDGEPGYCGHRLPGLPRFHPSSASWLRGFRKFYTGYLIGLAASLLGPSRAGRGVRVARAPGAGRRDRRGSGGFVCCTASGRSRTTRTADRQRSCHTSTSPRS